MRHEWECLARYSCSFSQCHLHPNSNGGQERWWLYSVEGWNIKLELVFFGGEIIWFEQNWKKPTDTKSKRLSSSLHAPHAFVCWSSKLCGLFFFLPSWPDHVSLTSCLLTSRVNLWHRVGLLVHSFVHSTMIYVLMFTLKTDISHFQLQCEQDRHIWSEEKLGILRRRRRTRCLDP